MKKVTVLFSLAVACSGMWLAITESKSRVRPPDPLLTKADWEAIYENPGLEFVHLDAQRMKRLIALPDISETILYLKSWLADGHQVAPKGLVERAVSDAVNHYAKQGDLEQQRRFEQYHEIVRQN